jgi:5'-deoxynucleotidase YfbR-like HD superfamily hydrolase
MMPMKIICEGWLRSGLPGLEVESIADHMYRMAIMALTLPDAVTVVDGPAVGSNNNNNNNNNNSSVHIDRQRCIRMALCHELN